MSGAASRKAIDLIGRIYDSVDTPESWRDTIDAIADSIGAGMAGFSVIYPSGGSDQVGVYRGIDSAARARYEEYYCRLNVHTRNLPADQQPGALIHSGTMDIDRELLRSEYYNDFLKPLDSFYVLGGLVANGSGCFAVFSAYRPFRKGAFSKSALHLMQAVLPHLRRAVSLSHELGALRSVSKDFDDLHAGAVLLGGAGAVLRVNRRAQSILDANDGIALRNGNFVLRDNSAAQELRHLISESGKTITGNGMSAGGLVVVRRPSGLPGFRIRVSPIRFTPLLTGALEPGTIVFIIDPAESLEIPRETLIRLYGLTPAEARLCIRLLQGDSLTTACELLTVSRNTGRTQLRAILAKLGVRTQSQMVAAVGRTVSTLAALP